MLSSAQVRFSVAVGCLLTSFLTGAATWAQPVDYDVVYVRQPRFGDDVNTTWPEVFHPAWRWGPT